MGHGMTWTGVVKKSRELLDGSNLVTDGGPEPHRT